MHKLIRVLPSALLLVSVAAFADPTYHLKDSGMCNKGSKSVRIHYAPYNQYTNFHDIEVDGITKHSSGDELKPGDCATMTFKVGPGFQGADPTRSEMSFYADDSSCTVRFSSVTHSVSTDTCDDGMAVHHHGDDDNFQIDVKLD